MFEQLCDELPWSQRLSEVWRMRDPEERDASLALRSAHGNRLRKAVGWYRNHGRLHTGDPVAMATDALEPTWHDRAAGKECPAGLRHLGDGRRTEPAPTRHPRRGMGPVRAAARDQTIGVGDSSSVDATTPPSSVRPGPGADIGADQVRNGNRWRVAAIDPRRTASPPSGSPIRPARVRSDYLRQHVTLGYAVTVHTAQGVTADTAHAILGESATRAMAYVG